MYNRESGYYPPGAEFDPQAPWNEKETPEREFDVFISQSLSKSTTVTTDDYYLEGDYLDPEDGGYEEYPVTDETNWAKAYDKEHYTPLELIGTLKCICKEILKYGEMVTDYKLERLVRECSDWVEDELVVEKE